MKKLVLIAGMALVLFGNAEAISDPFWVYLASNTDTHPADGGYFFADANNVRGNDSLHTRVVWSVELPKQDGEDIANGLGNLSESQKQAFINQAVQNRHPTPSAFVVWCALDLYTIADGPQTRVIPGSIASAFEKWACAVPLQTATKAPAPKKAAPSNTVMKL